MGANYTTDLTDINLVNVAGGTTNWTALGGGAAGLVAETDFYIQGDGCLSKGGWSTNTRGMIYNNAAGITFPSNSALFMWLYYWAPNALDIEINGGTQIIIGSSAAAYKHWYVKGSDTWTYGGWQCIPLDPTVAQDQTTGAPTATLQYFGGLAKVTGSVTKGQPFGIDAFRYGRTLIVTSGDTAGYATFAGAASTNDTLTNRWGLFQAIDGGYLHQGLFQMGTTGSTVDFRDSNRNIAIANTKKVTSGFTGYEVFNSGSRVEWDGITISALGTTSKGYFLINTPCYVNMSDCVFNSMDTFVFKSGSTVTNTKFNKCDLVTQSGATFNGCDFSESSASVALLVDNLDLISDCNFISDGTGHAIQLTTTGVTGSYTLSNTTFTGYATVSGVTGNEAIYNNSGGFITINITNDGDTPSIRNGTNASTTVLNSVSLTFTGLVDGSELRVYRTSDSAELYGIETVSGGQAIFSYDTGGGTAVYIVVISRQYENLKINYTLPTSNTSLPIQQKFDRWYSNP